MRFSGGLISVFFSFSFLCRGVGGFDSLILSAVSVLPGSQLSTLHHMSRTAKWTGSISSVRVEVKWVEGGWA
ncbi:hypothetical protein HOY80DRAFT_949892 [Tuber brumale]|nr:hypothetical protein HOY80DRAFT_949892 [Tuber brumale]